MALEAYTRCEAKACSSNRLSDDRLGNGIDTSDTYTPLGMHSATLALNLVARVVKLMVVAMVVMVTMVVRMALRLYTKPETATKRYN